jgi:methylmalonyl-CoA/ethylmalonyl-CoA epimerase
VTDLDRSVAFYKDVLGLPFLFTAPPQMAFFRCGDVRLLLASPEGEGAPTKSSMIYFRVPTISVAARGLKERGVRFNHEPHVVHRAGGKALWLAEFSDPDGNPLCVMSEEDEAAIASPS